MSRIEKLIVLVVFVGLGLFVPAALWALTQPDIRLEMANWSRPLAMVLALLSFVAVLLLFRDLYERQLQNKGKWVAAIVLTGGVAMIPYTFLHAFHPRRQDARV